MKKILTLFVSLLFIAATSMVMGAVTGAPPVYLFAGLVGASFIPMPAGVMSMAITKEIWIADIVANLFKANPHLSLAYNADQFVLAGKVVHIPNAGAKSVVTKNRTEFPATVVTRTDVDITFSLDEFSAAPMKIANAEKYELSYDKRSSVLGEMAASMAEAVGDWFFYYWAPAAAAQQKRTTGANTVAHVGTGNRKLITLADIKGIQTAMNKQGIPTTDRYAVLDADMYAQFTDLLTASTYRDFVMGLNPETGTVGKLYGFTFLEPRANVLTFNNATPPVAYTPAETPTAATAMASGLFWQKDAVIRALGTNEFFEDISNPLYYGDIYSALVRAGGRLRRNDGYGVFGLIQDLGAV